MLTHDRLKELVHYDPETGVLFWRQKRGLKPAGSKHSAGYLEIMIENKRTFVHRVIWFYMTGEWPKLQIDHINGIRNDNRWINLREADQKQNSANMRKRSNNKVGLKGVSRHRDKFIAFIHVDGRSRYLGLYQTPEEAHEVYKTAAASFFGEYARVA